MRRLILAASGALLVWGLSMGFCEAQVQLDETNVVLGNSSANLGYEEEATPNINPNCIFLTPAGVATWSANLTPGQKYTLTSRRHVYWEQQAGAGNLGFSIDMGGVLQVMDWATSPLSWNNDQYAAQTFFGYYTPTTATTAVKILDGGPYMSRIDYLSFAPTYDVYFDVNSSITLHGNAEKATFSGMSGAGVANYAMLPMNGINELYFDNTRGSGYLYGNVTLEPAATYSVYACREVSSTGDYSYDVLLGGQLFAQDGAIPVSLEHQGYIEEICLGTYVPSTSTTSVELSYPGSGGARVGYIRFAQVYGPPTASVQGAKNAVDGSGAQITAAVVSAAFPEYFYLESDDRTYGVRVNMPGHDLTVGMRADVTGTIATSSNGEKYINASYAAQDGTGTVNPLGMTNISLGGVDSGSPESGMGQRGVTGGAGPNNIGLLVRTWGEVTSVGDGSYTIEDGSGVSVAVEMPSGSTLQQGEFVALTGISSCQAVGQSINRFLIVGDDGINSSPPLSVQNQGTTLTLANSSSNYALASVSVNGVSFSSGGLFPTFELYEPNGSRVTYGPNSPGWVTDLSVNGNIATVNYMRSGFVAQVTYEVDSSGVLVTVTPTVETGYKALDISDGGSMIYVPQSLPGASTSAFLVSPYGGGEVLGYPSTQTTQLFQWSLNWWYPANFLGIGYNGQGLILTCPQYGAKYTYGANTVNSSYSLTGGMQVYFRPSQLTDFSAPPVDPSLQIRIATVGDYNNDGTFNWVDFGMEYRDQFIQANTSLDPNFYWSISGKIDIDPLTWPSAENYDQILAQMQQVDQSASVRQLWWFVGAHTPPGLSFVVPPYSMLPDPSHNGPSGLDYFGIKQETKAQMGASLGIHEMGQNVCPLNSEWGHTAMREYPDGQSWNNWTDTAGNTDYGKNLVDPGFFSFLNFHFQNWQTGPGDTWHWDVFTSEGAVEDYNPAYLATWGKDIRNRMATLAYIKSLGIHITSEGLEDGVSQYLDAAWTARYANAPEGAGAQLVPLTPVLFQGKTYYYSSLLYGGKSGTESTSLDAASLTSNYAGWVVPWQQIAKRTVQDVTQTSTGWTFTYAIDSVGGLASVSSPAAGTALYNGIDALVNDESGPTIRRYNYTSGGSVNATAQPVAGISAVDYAGYPSLVTTESDGKIRRYNFYTGGNNDISVAPQAAISSMLYACHSGVVTSESDGNIRRYNFTIGGSNDVVITPPFPISTTAFADFYDGVVAQDTHARVRRFNFATGTNDKTFLPVDPVTQFYNGGFGAVVSQESDGRFRRYNFGLTTTNLNDATVTAIANITQVLYVDSASVVTHESDGRIRHYNLNTGGNADCAVQTVAGIVTICYAGSAGVMVQETDGKIRRYNFSIPANPNDATVTPVSGITSVLYAGFAGVVLQEPDTKVRRYNASSGGSLDAVLYPITTALTYPLVTYDGVVTQESDGESRSYTMDYTNTFTYNTTTNTFTFTYRQ